MRPLIRRTDVRVAYALEDHTKLRHLAVGTQGEPYNESTRQRRDRRCYAANHHVVRCEHPVDGVAEGKIGWMRLDRGVAAATARQTRAFSQARLDPTRHTAG